VTRTTVAFTLVAAFLMAPAANAAGPLPSLTGESYAKARAEIVKSGYRPVRFVRTEDGCLLDTTCKRYPALLGSHPARCQFAFVDRSHGKYIVVSTRGDSRRVDNVTFPSRRERSRWPQIRS
jgi:hypothetical protein